jgi:hypothetical protein
MQNRKLKNIIDFMNFLDSSDIGDKVLAEDATCTSIIHAISEYTGVDSKEVAKLYYNNADIV